METQNDRLNDPSVKPEQPLAARAMREIIRTPAFREILKLHLSTGDSAAASETMKTILNEDIDLSLSVAQTMPQRMNNLIESLLELARWLDGFPPELMDEFIRQLANDIDMKRLAQTPIEWMPHLIHLSTIVLAAKAKDIGSGISNLSATFARLQREHPEWIEQCKPALVEMVSAIDFGKVREGLVALSAAETEIIKTLAAKTLNDPVSLANLFMTIPPILNDLSKVTNAALVAVDLPPEILASAVFNGLAEIDYRELGRASSRIAQLINQLHEGNYILGRDEPRFRAVCIGALENYLSGMDAEKMAQAVVALSDDAETVVAAAMDVMRHDPQKLLQLETALVAMNNAFFRMWDSVLHNADQLSDETLVQFAAMYRSNLDTEAMARAFNATATLVNRYANIDPNLLPDLTQQFIAHLNREEFAALATNTGRAFGMAVTNNREIQKSLTPEDVGEAINRRLKKFNAFMENRQNQKDGYSRRLMAAIDSQELEKAMRYAGRAFVDVLTSNARQGMALLKPATSATGRIVRFYAGAIKRKALGQGEYAKQ